MDLEISLNDVPVALLLSDKTFKLGAIVGYTSNETGGLGHYKAYCYRRNSEWECYDDMITKMIRVKKNININSHLLVYFHGSLN